MSYEVWGDNDDDSTTASHLLDNGWWDDDTVQRVKDAVQALRSEAIYENERKDDGISVKFLMRMAVLSAEVGLMEESDPIVIEARAALGVLR